MKMSTAFPTKYISAADLTGRACVVTIETTVQETVGQPPENRPVVYFRGKQKGFILNKTNAHAITFLHGDESDNWRGKQIEIYPTTTDFAGRIVDCIRVRGPGQVAIPPSNGGVAATPASDHQAPLNPAPLQGSPAPTGGDDLDDEIPF